MNLDLLVNNPVKAVSIADEFKLGARQLSRAYDVVTARRILILCATSFLPEICTIGGLTFGLLPATQFTFKLVALTAGVPLLSMSTIFYRLMTTSRRLEKMQLREDLAIVKEAKRRKPVLRLVHSRSPD